MSLADQRMHAMFGQWPNQATGSGSVELTNFVTRTIAPEKYVCDAFQVNINSARLLSGMIFLRYIFK